MEGARTIEGSTRKPPSQENDLLLWFSILCSGKKEGWDARQRQSWCREAGTAQRLPPVARNGAWQRQEEAPSQRQGVAEHNECRKPKVEMKAERKVETDSSAGKANLQRGERK